MAYQSCSACEEKVKDISAFFTALCNISCPQGQLGALYEQC